ncbi:unnamed protein product [Angiostrongylus costaricensis]|uniref:Ig-like domain-containing protein n=1 Tax=Angiostrongylus costaricensis TaxID=334426 RepID=A0A158PL97_ANGCS|nr:unnamed protein product [Angiostrongylus costaricensis]
MSSIVDDSVANEFNSNVTIDDLHIVLRQHTEDEPEQDNEDLISSKFLKVPEEQRGLSFAASDISGKCIKMLSEKFIAEKALDILHEFICNRVNNETMEISLLALKEFLVGNDLDGFEESDFSDRVISVNEGGYFVIRRPKLIASDDPLPNTEYFWYNGDNQVSSNASHYVTSRGDLGTLEYKLDCKVDSSSGVLFDQKSLVMNVIDIPLLKPLPREILQPLGSTLTISCSRKRRRDASSTIRWYFNGREIATKKSKLVVQELSQEDYGIYQCETSNDAGSSMNTIWVKEGMTPGGVSGTCKFSRSEDEQIEEAVSETGFGAPVITISPKDVSFVVGSKTLKLQCTAIGVPTTAITWRFHDVDITSTSEKYDITEDGLVIHDLKKSDSGRYSCIAKNSFGMTSATARVTATGSNLIEFGPTNQSVVIGTNIVIPCEVTADYETNAHVMWFMNDEPIPVTGNPNLRLSRKNNGGLLIRQVGPDNIGEYRCVVTADGKEESASAFLRIIERPQMPTFVRAELINSTIPAKIRVSWVEGFDGNSPIIKHSVEMRTLGPTQLWSDWEVVVDNVPSEVGVLYALYKI